MNPKALTALAASFTVALVALASPTVDNVPPTERPGFRRIRAAELKADLYFLSSDALQGRMSLQPGDEVATQWVAAEFAQGGP